MVDAEENDVLRELGLEQTFNTDSGLDKHDDCAA